MQSLKTSVDFNLKNRRKGNLLLLVLSITQVCFLLEGFRSTESIRVIETQFVRIEVGYFFSCYDDG